MFQRSISGLVWSQNLHAPCVSSGETPMMSFSSSQLQLLLWQLIRMGGFVRLAIAELLHLGISKRVGSMVRRKRPPWARITQ